MQLLNQVQKITLYIFFFSISFEMLVPSSLSSFSVARITGMLYLITVIPQLQFFLKTDNLSAVLVPIWLYFGLSTLNNLANVNELYDQVFNQPMFLNILIFWLMINHVRKDYLLLEKAMLSFALGTMLLTLFFILGIGVEYEGGRVAIFQDNENSIALKISMGLIIFLLAVVQNRLKWGWYRFLLLIPVPFMLKLLAETGSRVAVISFVLAFVVGIVLIKTDSVWKKIAMYVGGLIVFIVIAVQLLQSEVLMERLSSTAQSGDLGGRAKIWETIIPLIKNNPVFGVGNTGYNYYSVMNLNEIVGPHNVILEVLCYTGLVGLTIFLTFLFQIFIRGYRSYLKNGWLLPLLLISPILGMIMSGQILYVKMGWIVFAYIVSTSAIRYGDIKITRQFEHVE